MGTPGRCCVLGEQHLLPPILAASDTWPHLFPRRLISIPSPLLSKKASFGQSAQARAALLFKLH